MENYKRLASIIEDKNANRPNGWLHEERALIAFMESAPREKGIEEISLDRERSNSSSIFSFDVKFRVMCADGYCVGRREFRVDVRPDFLYGLEVSVVGKASADIKKHIAAVFTEWLISE